jgi:hypothetical protein
MRFVAFALLLALVALPLAVLPSLPLAWLAVPGFIIGVVGVIALSVPLVTAGAALALIEYTLALTITKTPVDVVTAAGFGAAVFLLLQLVHFAGRVHGATIGSAVIASQIRHWLAIVGIASAVTIVLTIGAPAVRLALTGVPLPLVVVAGALGALVTIGGVIALARR